MKKKKNNILLHHKQAVRLYNSLASNNIYFINKINFVLQEGMTPLHLAAKHGHGEVLEALKDHLDLSTSSSKSGFTALHVAAHFGQTNTVRELLSRLSAAVTSVLAKDGTEV